MCFTRVLAVIRVVTPDVRAGGLTRDRPAVGALDEAEYQARLAEILIQAAGTDDWILVAVAYELARRCFVRDQFESGIGGAVSLWITIAGDGLDSDGSRCTGQLSKSIQRT